MSLRATAAALALLAPVAGLALPPSSATKMVAAAREVLGTPYQFGGRLRGGEGLDCQGVLFLAAEAIGRCGWKSFSVYPTLMVKAQELGAPVEGLSPVRSDRLDLARLEPGDVLLLVHPTENPAEGPIATLDGAPVWVWHTGLYAGGGKWLVGDHFAGKVVETDLAKYLADHASSYTGVFVTRMKVAPAPARCRTGPAMGAR
ncbi:MAG: hypothetical protein ACYC8T_18245 [Myxococcaceae bacterium]